MKKDTGSTTALYLLRAAIVGIYCFRRFRERLVVTQSVTRNKSIDNYLQMPVLTNYAIKHYRIQVP